MRFGSKDALGNRMAMRYRLAREFGWTPREIGEMDAGAVELYGKMLMVDEEAARARQEAELRLKRGR